MKFLVTGANGFIGQHVCDLLCAQGHELCAAVRCAREGAQALSVGAIDESTDWSSALAGVQVVVHLAGRAHVMKDEACDPEAAYWRVNVAGSLNLAKQAIGAGVRRFVYVSSIKASGEQSFGKPLTEADTPQPEDAYGRSKLAAERALTRLAQETGLELVIVRPCMVVGEGVKGNLAALVGALARGLPLPLGAIRNQRSLVGVRSLAALLLLCAEHPAAVGEVFFAAAPEALSTPALVRCLAEGLALRPRLWAWPVGLLSLLAQLTGKQGQMRRLSTDLDVSSAKAHQQLGWQSSPSLRDELHAAARGVCAAKVGVKP